MDNYFGLNVIGKNCIRFFIVLCVISASINDVNCRRRQRQRQRPIMQLIANRNNSSSDHGSNIFFKFYLENSSMLDVEATVSDLSSLKQSKCNPKDRFAIIIHGYRESCNTEWVVQLIKKLNQYRGGCIICMDYSRYALAENYLRLIRQFEPIVNVLTNFLFELETIGFDMDKGYMFGFSYGGQLACEAGRRIGFQNFREIDTCDMAGPGFDFRIQTNHRTAAKNVQCIHTSRDKGTRHYNCHQDWRLGNCGFSQAAASDPPFGSHGLCPYMYISAFDNDFFAVDKPKECTSRQYAKTWPYSFRMGYFENRKNEVVGELFAYTSQTFPYNSLSDPKIIPFPDAEYDYLDDLFQNVTDI